MFEQNKFLLSVNRKTVTLYKNASGKNAAEEKLLEKEWQSGQLSEIFAELKNKFKFSVLRILLGDDLSYSLILTIPKDEYEKAPKKRDFIYLRIKEMIPEILTDDEWDYKKEPITDKKNYTIRVFSPVKQFFLELQSAAKKNRIKIDAIESISNAFLRNPDVVASVLNKKDITGNDEDVLNVQPKMDGAEEEKIEVATPISTNVADEPKADVQVVTTVDSTDKKIILMIVVSFLILCFAILLFFFLQNRNKLAKLNQKNNPKVISNLIVKPSASRKRPTPTASSSAQIDKSKLALQILNGNGEAGASAKMADFLKTKGYAQFEMGNAETFDFETTEINVKKNGVFLILKKDLEKNYQISSSSATLLSNDKYDTTIIIGKK
jgi:hypothetical protein